MNHCQIGDCRSVLQEIPDESFQCCVTSPPYWCLRDYGVAAQIGMEKTPEEYVQEIVAVFREVRRVLRSDGTLWLNIGDTYKTTVSGTASEDPLNRDGRLRLGSRPNRQPQPGLKHKDMVGIPWMIAFALRNDGWWLRSEIIWSKANPMPESIADRPTKAHEQIFLLAKSANYFYDADAIAEPASLNTHARGKGVNPKAGKNGAADDNRKRGFNERWRTKQNASFAAAVSGVVAKRNKRDVWTIPSEPYSGSHFATMPTALVAPCILAGSRVGDAVLDPFFGSGTVGQVAEQLGRRWFGIEINPEYEKLLKRRTAQTGLRFR